MRGVSADPERIVVCTASGTASTCWPGAPRDRPTRFAVEDPGYDGARTRLDCATGAAYRAVDVDGEGLVVDALRRTTARAVVVTPAHQSPTGVVLSPAAPQRARGVGPARSTAT